jgi:hypothetical protein
MLESLKNTKENIESFKKELDFKQKEIQTETLRILTAKQEIQKLQDSIYQAQQKELHLSQIIRLASIQFPRLRNQTDVGLTIEDKQEIEKWISRTKSNDGLIAIVKALEELVKFSPSQVKNIYALTQKIIIEGPWKGNKKWKN